MQRKDLKAGQEYWYSNKNDWNEHLYDGYKAVVVDTDPWEQPRRIGWSTWPAPVKVKKGLGVLVDVYSLHHSTHEEVVTRKVVLVTHLRGEYETTRAGITEFEEKRNARYQARVEATKRADEQAKKVIDLASGLNIHVRHGGGEAMIISQADLTTLLHMAKNFKGF